jgi:hypothetical protein
LRNYDGVHVCELAVGDEVKWWLIPTGDYRYLSEALGDDVRRAITHWLEIACWGEEPRRDAMRGRIMSIEAVHVARWPNP